MSVRGDLAALVHRVEVLSGSLDRLWMLVANKATWKSLELLVDYVHKLEDRIEVLEKEREI